MPSWSPFFVQSGGGGSAPVAGERGGGPGDAVEARAVVPQYFSPLVVVQLQAEELLDRLGERAVGVRIVARHHEVLGAHLLDDVHRRLLVHVERDVALALEVLARRHLQLVLAAGPELLPLVVEPPQPPVQPPGRPFEERAAQLRVAVEDAAGGHARDRAHELDRVANRVGDRVEIGVPDVALPGVVFERGVAGRMEADGHVELFELVPERLARRVVEVLAVDGVGRADHRDGAELLDAAARLLDGEPDVVHRDLRGELEPPRIFLAVVVGPVVVGAGQRRGVVGLEIVVAEDLPPARAVHDGDVDALDIHRRQRRGGIVAARPRDVEVGVARPALPPELAGGGGRALRLRKRRDRQPLHLHAADVVGVALVLRARLERLLLPGVEPRRVLPVGLIQVTRPQAIGLVHVQIAVDDQVAFTCHTDLLTKGRWRMANVERVPRSTRETHYPLPITHYPLPISRYCGCKPICFTSFAYITVSSLISLASSSGVEPTASRPTEWKRSWVSGCLMMR